MESDEVMLAVRLTTAERTLLRWLARGHRGDVSEVVADALLDVLPALLAGNAPPPAEQPGRAAPCAVTVWLPPELADLLPALATRLAPGPRPSATPGPPTAPDPSAAPGPPTAPGPCAALGTALRLWLRQDPARLAAGLRAMHAHPSSRSHPHPHVHPYPHPHVHPLAA
ncbi:hypothetical protein ACFC6L_11560 [Kitasatospora phosalacinea]|uniref:hypothetical protein n=1 Tax=Kitasatospora phosalacinea TaxID=2065 RepID=UPI0035DB06AC